MICKEFYEKIDTQASYRRIPTLKRFLEAICRLHLRYKPINSDYKLMTDLISEIELSKKKYIQKNQENFAKEESVEDLPIHHKCSICGADKSDTFLPNGNPACNDCKASWKVQFGKG